MLASRPIWGKSLLQINFDIHLNKKLLSGLDESSVHQTHDTVWYLGTE